MDKGILLKPDMAQAADEGRKGQTRRMEGLNEINAEPDAWELTFFDTITGIAHFLHRDGHSVTVAKCPYAKGQRLYLKEVHYRYGKWGKNGKTKTGKQAWRFYARSRKGPLSNVFFDADDIYTVRPNSYRKRGWYKRSPLFMPKKFARKWFVVTEGPVPEKVQDITRSDIRAEGVIIPPHMSNDESYKRAYLDAWVSLWNSIHGPGAWDRNDWLWKVTFKKD